MRLADIPAGTAVFVDANLFLFALTHHAVHGTACEVFFDRSENRDITAITSTYILLPQLITAQVRVHDLDLAALANGDSPS